MPAYMGGLKIESLAWESPRALRCRFVSNYSRAWHHLYAGRSRVGTCQPGQRSLTAQLLATDWPEHLTLLAVDVADRLTDFGDGLPPRPYNRVRLRFTADSFPADCEFIDITAGTEPGGAVDADNRIARLLFKGDGEYAFLTDPLAGSGEWDFRITPRDSRPASGNAGTAVDASQTVLAHPPDVQLASSGDRFTAVAAAGLLTVTATLPV